MKKVQWFRSPFKDVEVRSLVLSTHDVIDSDWCTTEEGINTTIHNDLVDVSSLLSNLGSSGRVMAQRDPESQKLTKEYLTKYIAIQGSNSKILLDQVSIKQDDYQTPFFTSRQKVISGDEITLAQVFETVNAIPSFDCRSLVIGTTGRTAEFQFLFGEDIPLENTNEQGDILNQGLFFAMNGGVYNSIGFNRLVCTNGLILPFESFKRQTFDRTQLVDQLSQLESWFTALPLRRVESVRKLAMVVRGYPTSALKHHWEDWSKAIELKTLTYFDVINDLTSFANNSLSSTRYECIRITDATMNKLNINKCNICGAKLA